MDDFGVPLFLERPVYPNQLTFRSMLMFCSSKSPSTLYPLHDVLRKVHLVETCWKNIVGIVMFGSLSSILLMEASLHHPTCVKPCKQWDIYHINWWSPDFWTINSSTDYWPTWNGEKNGHINKGKWQRRNGFPLPDGSGLDHSPYV